MPHRVVVVNPINDPQKHLTQLIQDCGHILVEELSSYEEALQAVTAYRPTITVVGLAEPPEEGLLTIEKIRRMDPKANIVAYSMHGPNKKVLELCKELKVADFLVEPVSQDRFLKSFINIKPPDEKRERGAVVCVGYTPSHIERNMISQLKLSYLYYPSCHLAIQMFKQRRQKRLIILVIQEGLEMYSGMFTKSLDILAELKSDAELPPWVQVIKEAQVYYQEFWGDAIIGGLLPQQIPCLYTSGPGQFPVVLPLEIIDTLNASKVRSPNDFKQIISPESGAGSTTEVVREVVEEVSGCLDEVEKKHPDLLMDKPETTEQPHIPKGKKIEPVKEKKEKPKAPVSRMALLDTDESSK